MAKPSGEDKLSAQMTRVRQLHMNVVSSVAAVQDQTAAILANQERDLLRAFKGRLVEVQSSLEATEEKVAVAAAPWKAKHDEMEKELRFAKDSIDRQERTIAALKADVARLQQEASGVQEDRSFVVKQLVAAKKEGAKLKTELEARDAELIKLREEVESLRESEMSRMSGGGGAGAGPSALAQRAATSGIAALNDEDLLRYRDGLMNSTGRGAASAGADDIGRYREVISRLRRILDAERRATKQARQALMAEVHERTEAELFLRTAIADAKAALEEQRAAAAAAAASAASSASPSRSGSLEPNVMREGTPPWKRIPPAQRADILAELLAQDHLLTALHAVAFPDRSKYGEREEGEGGAGGSKTPGKGKR